VLFLSVKRPKTGKKKTFPRKGKSSLRKKRKQRSHGKTGRELLVQFRVLGAAQHGVSPFLLVAFFIRIILS
jgi:hypothetical protein